MTDHLEIPQATLARTREMVDAVVAGARTREEIAAETGISRRQVGYGVVSARALGLLDEHDDELSLTGLGRELGRTPVGSREENEQLSRALGASPLFALLAPGLLGDEPPTREAIAVRIGEVSGIGLGTARHRAGMLLGWRRQLFAPPDSARRKRRRLGGRWRRLEVRGYRSLESVQLELAPLTVLIGPIGSGKSTLADALVLGAELGRDGELAIRARGGIGAMLRWGHSGPIVVDLKAAATRAALGDSFFRHRLALQPTGPGAWQLAEELVELRHQGERLARLERAAATAAEADPDEARRSIVPLAVADASFGKLVPLRQCRRLAVDPAGIRRPDRAEGTLPGVPGGSLGAALGRVRRSRSYAGLLEAMRNIVPGLHELELEAGETAEPRLVARQTLAPGVLARLGLEGLSDGALSALAMLLAATQVGADELLVVEHPERFLDAAALPLVLEALRAVSRRATVVLTTHHEHVAELARPGVIVHCRFHAGRTEVSAPGLRVID